jgi:hypothetical protein
MTIGPRYRFASPDEIAKLTRGKRMTGNQWMGHCPCHDDQTPSLSIRWGRKSGTVVKCHAGCEQKELLAWLRKQGLRLDRIESDEAKPKPPHRRAVTVETSVAFRTLTLSERRMYDLIKGGTNPSYNQMEAAGVRREAIPQGRRAMEALGLILADLAPYNAQKQRYGRNAYRVIDRWRDFEPMKPTAKARQEALARAKAVAKAARRIQPSATADEATSGVPLTRH